MSMLQPVRGEAGPTDPVPLPWAQLELPDAWPDALDLRRPRDLVAIPHESAAAAPEHGYGFPPDLPLNVALPEYLLLEFHNLPNGNYSKRSRAATAPASTSVMLGEMRRARRAMPQALNGCGAVLDVGCGAGHSTRRCWTPARRKSGDWTRRRTCCSSPRANIPRRGSCRGLPSAAVLPRGASMAVTACFLFHEMPPPSPSRRSRSFGASSSRRPAIGAGACRRTVLQAGLGGCCGSTAGAASISAGWRASSTNRSLAAWQKRDVPAWLARHGFELIEDRELFPARLITARRIG